MIEEQKNVINELENKEHALRRKNEYIKSRLKIAIPIALLPIVVMLIFYVVIPIVYIKFIK